mmetsp:Transcript_3945/g.9366  ORF Transcript_3945/g.9366 Transcript_3945/m.9366 type:complete len:108 (+) Transcript_3945:926-1249(+)
MRRLSLECLLPNSWGRKDTTATCVCEHALTPKPASPSPMALPSSSFLAIVPPSLFFGTLGRIPYFDFPWILLIPAFSFPFASFRNGLNHITGITLDIALCITLSLSL